MNLKRLGNLTYKSYFNVKNADFKKIELTEAVGIKYKNGYIIKQFSKSYLYIVDDVLIANRCGFSLELLKKFIETKCSPKDYDLKHKINKELE